MTLMTAPPAQARTADHLIPADPASPASARRYADPLDADMPGDDLVVTTRRAISRVALVATETAGRFQREGLRHDPMTWMLAPRALFGGMAALEACLDRDACLRGILIHGLSIGLDADPAVIDALVADDDGDNLQEADGEELDFSDAEFERPPASAESEGEPRLFTATVVANDGFETVHAFHASLAIDEPEIAGRLYMRMGAVGADAVIVEGFDPGDPMVQALVAPAICDTLIQVMRDPDSPLAAGIDVNVEQRFLN